MFGEIIYAFFFAALPLFVFTYAVLWWINRHNISKGDSPIFSEDLDLESLNDVPEGKENVVQEKWMTFGGGFYGMVGLLTYGVSEYREIRDMIANFQGFNDGLVETLIDLIITFIIQSLTNIVDAVTWPWFWGKELEGARFWVLIVAAYIGYLVALELIKYLHRSKPGTDQ